MTMGGGILLRLDWERLREHVLTTGVVRHACRHRVTARGGFWFGGFFHMLGAWERHRFNGGAVAVCFEGCCGGMCWPVDRPANRSRRWSGSTPPCGGAGEEVFGLGDSFTRSGVDGTRGLGVGGLIRCAGRPREWSCGAVPPQERWHEGGGVVFVFSLGVAPVSEGDSFTRSGVVIRRRAASGETARGVLVFGLGDSFAVGLGAVAGACVGRGSGQPRMPPRERLHEGFWFLVWGILLRLDWELLREHVLAAGAASHACRRGSGSTRSSGFLFGEFFHTHGSGRREG